MGLIYRSLFQGGGRHLTPWEGVIQELRIRLVSGHVEQ